MVTATVTDTISPQFLPTGTVLFTVGPLSVRTCQLSAGSCTAVLPGSFFVAGANTVTATYEGNTDAYTGSEASASVTASNPLSTTITLAASANSITTGTNVTLTANVASTSGSGLPTGNVTFYSNGATIGTSPLSSTGAATATLTTSFSSTGSTSLTAAYRGDATYSASTSNTVPLTITAPVPSFTISLNSTAQSIGAGSSANSTITVTPSGGFAGTVSFSCSATIPSGSCSVSSSTMPGSSSATATLTVQTAGTQAAISTTSRIYRAGFGWLGCIALGALLFGARRRYMLAAGLGLFLVFAALGISGCGGSNGGGNHQTSGTPAGTYPAIATATSGSITQTAIFSVTVTN